MDRRRKIQRTIFTMLAADVLLVLIFAAFTSKGSRYAPLLAAACFAALVGSNFVVLHRKLRAQGPADPKGRTERASGRFWAYAGSAVFFVGSFYGILMVSQGTLPWTTLLALPVPLSVAVVFFRIGRNATSKKA